MSLRDSQALFWRAITWPTGVGDFLAQADPATRRRFEQTFASTEAFDRVQRMEVYAEAYFWRLFDVLHDGFPALAFSLGDAAFRNLITDYVLQRPSVEPALRHLGDQLVEFLESHPCGEDAPWASELARLEHWRYRLLDVADVETIDRAALARFSIDQWPGLRFRLASSAVLLSSRYDVHATWASSREASATPSPPPGGPDGEFRQLVWRRGFAVVHRSLGPAEGRALQALVAGLSFHEITAHASLDEDGRGDPAEIVGWLDTWLSAGIIGEVIAE